MFRNIKVHAGFSRVLTKDEKRLQTAYARLDQIKEYFDEYGKLPATRSSSLGIWIVNMRQAKKGQGTYKWEDGYLIYAIKVGLPKDIFGKYPSSRSGSLGVWLNNMRQAKKGKGRYKWNNKYIGYAVELGLPNLFGTI